MKKINPVACAVKHTAVYMVIVGLFLVLLGVAIWFKPEIVTFLVTAFFAFMGVVSILFGIQVWSFYKKILTVFKKFKLD